MTDRPVSLGDGPRSLDDVLRRAPSPVTWLRESQTGPYAFPVVPAEFTNWRDEQRAWRETCALFDQSHHMTDLYVSGPDARRLFSDLGINSFARFPVGRAKQFVACNPDGYVIGDAILFHLEEDAFNLVGRPSAPNWVQYHAETGDYDVTVERDERSAVNRGQRRVFRYQVQGPHAARVMAEAAGEPMPDVPFFAMETVRIAGHPVRALRHGMVGQPGWELFGAWEAAEAVRAALLEAGRPLGLCRVGARTYPTSTLESGWIPSPLPAVYAGEALAAYRRWLPADGYEGRASLGGSFVAEDVTAYYLTPFELGYGPFVRFDHEFVGRPALERRAATHRCKVTLVWNGEDVANAMGTLFLGDPREERAKYLDLPLANYATLPFDAVVRDGRPVGLSTYTGYSVNEGAMLSLAVVDPALSEPGTPVTVRWGEPAGGSSKPTVERHRQVDIRATVGPVPISKVARESYRPR